MKTKSKKKRFIKRSVNSIPIINTVELNKSREVHQIKDLLYLEEVARNKELLSHFDRNDYHLDKHLREVLVNPSSNMHLIDNIRESLTTEQKEKINKQWPLYKDKFIKRFGIRPYDFKVVDFIDFIGLVV